MCITWSRACSSIHLLWCLLYTIVGTIQIIFGIFFWISLPVLKLGSNVWVGAGNVVFGLIGAVAAMIGRWSLAKQRSFLYLAISVLVVNVINLILLEVGEWHLLLPESAKKLIEEGNLKTLILYARIITSVSTLLAVAIAFLDSQFTFCSMQYHERYHHKKASEKQDILSDTEYVLPRVKSDSDENDNAGYFDKEYPQSWVYETHTAETSTINSAPNRYSGSSSENVIDSKKTSTDTEFKDISSQNLRMEQPVVIVEKTADYTDRQLHYMTSFSRTPSPVPASDSSSEDLRLLPGRGSGAAVAERRNSDRPAETATGYRGRINSTRSTCGVPPVEDPPYSTMSSRPISISEMDQLPNELLLSAALDTTSQKSFKISADQIFIPLKDETVIRVKDEIFIIPSPKVSPRAEENSKQIKPPETSKPAATAQQQPQPPSIASFIEKKHDVGGDVAAPKSEKQEKGLEQVTSRIMKSIRKPSMPEIVDALPKPHSAVAHTPTLEKGVDSLLTTSTSAVAAETTSASSPSPVLLEETPKSEDSISSSQEPDQLSEEMPEADSPAGTYTLPSPVLQRPTQLEKGDSERDELPSPMLEHQDTVIEKKRFSTSPGLERQSQIERQDAMMFSPREDKSFESPPLYELDPLDEGMKSDDLESNGSTDRDSVVDVRYSGHALNASTPTERDGVGICDRLDLLEGISTTTTTTTEKCAVDSDIGRRVNSIFQAYDELSLDGSSSGGDGGGAGGGGSGLEEGFYLNKGSTELPPPELDPLMFANIPPPDDLNDGNNVDPDEWEDSDEDSIDSSCVRRVPPASTPNG